MFVAWRQWYAVLAVALELDVLKAAILVELGRVTFRCR